MAARGLNAAYLGEHTFGDRDNALAFVRTVATEAGVATRSVQWNPNRSVLACQFRACPFQVSIRLHRDDNLWHIDVPHADHVGHIVGERPVVERNRISRATWIRRQMQLRFADLVEITPGQGSRLEVFEAERPVFRAVLGRPFPREFPGSIVVDRWTLMDNGYVALSQIFGEDARGRLENYLDLHRGRHTDARRLYELIYPVREHAMLNEALERLDRGVLSEMSEDIAQMMVDATGIATILIRDFGGQERFEVVLLIPRVTTERRVSSRCLISYQGFWMVGDWHLPGHEGDSVPLFGLPIAHPRWRERYLALDGDRGIVAGFREHWMMYATHDVTQPLRQGH